MHPWRSRLDRWFGPLAIRCPLSPNQITITGMILNLVAAALLAMARSNPVFFLVAPAVATIGGLVDAFDGLVARHQKLESRFGDFLDHLCDRVSDLALLSGWILGAGVRPAVGFPSLILVMLSGYIGTQIEATWQERRYEGLGRGEFVLALVALPIAAYSMAKADVLGTRLSGLSIPEWLTVILGLAALLAIVSRVHLALEIARAKDNPE